jgi:gliding motility-associated-like protein
MNRQVLTVLFIFLSLSFFEASASHIVGGEFTYKYIGDSTSVSAGLYHKYRVSLTIYEDCQNGQPEAIAQDNPAFFGVYEGQTLVEADSAFFTTSIPVPANFTNACVSNIPPTCLLKKTFDYTFALKPNASGYVIDYQRCCRNNATVNIQDPGNNGSTYYCTIPPFPIVNNSAVFKNFPAQIICLNNPLYYDNSATDADGDSLSYGFCAALSGASSNVIKPWPPVNPTPPTVVAPQYFDSVVYAPGFNSQQPMPGYPKIQIDPVTGLITGTPNVTGRYLVNVYCNEYRHGVLINTIKREFQYVVTNCSKVVVADIPQYSSDPNTYIVDCADYTVNFVNTSSGGFSYYWNFGLPNVVNDTSTQFQPTFIYPDTGTFSVKLIVNPSSTCPDSITRLVKVYPKFRAAFTDSGGHCPGALITFKDYSSATIKPITFWQWNFGDGDSSFLQNPVHNFKYGGTYNVVLISKNIKNCIDTAVTQLLIDNFKPFAGFDTIIVKGESVYFNATGGTNYTWTPTTNLNESNVPNPVGFYPDTGEFTYSVHVTSPYGCQGYDTIRISVVNQASFFVPTAFTPNGDGLNDMFRPVAVGYRNLKFFRVFNRWGQEVYYGTNLEVGWDGTYNHKRADMGTYFWEIGFTDRFGNDSFLKGDVTLLR